ncbi:Hsp70 family protein [Actinoplanes sp. Pm04-4]|uniref:Hsp70 family protein n=1 Tax=Paractinoplanes pyxinae TaxID=2997416 RepID=A0ABT4B4Z0_9ACTN|nr:Hsp70 family protein [Actinoplanes pyxinae]MCY1141554.1 Hsp70 family protein [Actinoplanes pyxinae]
MNPQLTIDYGAVATRAVLVWPGRWIPLAFDGQVELSSAVHLADGHILVGSRAWQYAEHDPDGFVASPLHAGTGQIHVRGTAVEVADLVAATLRHVRTEAVQAAGGHIDDVRLVVPAGWGPRRHTWLRHICHTAGLPVTHLVTTPVAVARAAVPAPQSPPTPGATALVIDVGSGCEATVVTYGLEGWEVLSTLTDPDAGGDRIDAALTTAVTKAQTGHLTAGQQWTLLAAVRAAKQALTGQAAVTVPLPAARPAAVLTLAGLQQAAQPALEQAAALAATAVANADLTVEQIGAVHVIGAAAATPGTDATIAAKLGRPVQLAPYPGMTAAICAAESTTQSVPGPVALPPLRRLLGMAVPAVAALLLYAHFLLTADFNNGTPQRPRPGYYVLANWGELTVACVLICVTALQAAAILAALLVHQNPASGSAGQPPSRIAGGLLAAAGIGAALAGLLAITAAEFFAQPIADLMRWALLPLLPLLTAAIALAAVSHRLPQPPASGWDSMLAFPALSVVTATAGIAGIALWWHGPVPAALNGWADILGTAGGLLTGVAVAAALVRHPAGRVVLAVLVGFCTLILSRSGPDTVAVVYALSVAAWCGIRGWTVGRIPSP